MFKIFFKIIDSVKEYKVERISKWYGVYGGFEMQINDRIFGYCPKREPFPGEIWSDDILYMLVELADCIMTLANRRTYTLQLLPTTCGKIEFEYNSKLNVRLINEINSEQEWEETINIQEFKSEVYNAFSIFIEYIKAHNEKLLDVKEYKTILNTKKYLE